MAMVPGWKRNKSAHSGKLDLQGSLWRHSYQTRPALAHIGSCICVHIYFHLFSKLWFSIITSFTLFFASRPNCSQHCVFYWILLFSFCSLTSNLFLRLWTLCSSCQVSHYHPSPMCRQLPVRWIKPKYEIKVERLMLINPPRDTYIILSVSLTLDALITAC